MPMIISGTVYVLYFMLKACNVTLNIIYCSQPCSHTTSGLTITQMETRMFKLDSIAKIVLITQYVFLIV